DVSLAGVGEAQVADVDVRHRPAVRGHGQDAVAVSVGFDDVVPQDAPRAVAGQGDVRGRDGHRAPVAGNGADAAVARRDVDGPAAAAGDGLDRGLDGGAVVRPA